MSSGLPERFQGDDHAFPSEARVSPDAGYAVGQKLAQVTDKVAVVYGTPDAYHHHPVPYQDILSFRFGDWYVLTAPLDLGVGVQSGYGQNERSSDEPTVLPAGSKINVDPNNSDAYGKSMDPNLVKIKVVPPTGAKDGYYLRVPKENLKGCQVLCYGE